MFFYHKAWYTDKLQRMKTLHKTRGLLFWHVEHFRGMPVLTSQKLQNQVRNEKPVRYSESSCLMGPACHWSCALSGRRHSRHTHAGRCRQWMGRWLRHRGGPPLLSPAQQCCLLRGGSGKEWCFVCLYLCCGYVHREIRQKKNQKTKRNPKNHETRGRNTEQEMTIVKKHTIFSLTTTDKFHCPWLVACQWNAFTKFIFNKCKKAGYTRGGEATD